MTRERLVALIVVILALGMGMCVDALAQTAAPPDPATAHFANGYNLLKAGNADAAAKEFNAGLEIKSDNAMAWYYLGEARLKLGLNELAQAAYEKSLQLDPKGPQSELARTRLVQISPTTSVSAQRQPNVPSSPSAGAPTSPLKSPLSAQLQLLNESSHNDEPVTYMTKSGTVWDGHPIRLNLKDLSLDALLPQMRRRFASAEEMQSAALAHREADIAVAVDVTEAHMQISAMHFLGNDDFIRYSVGFSAFTAHGKRISKTMEIKSSSEYISSSGDPLEKIRVALGPLFQTSLQAAFISFLDSQEMIAFVGNVAPPQVLAANNSSVGVVSAPRAVGSVPRYAPPVESLPAEDQTHYQEVLKNGRPSQMYLLAVKMYTEHHVELGDRLCQAIVDHYPDDPYAAKAIDRLDSARQGAEQAAQQQQMMGQQQAFHEQQVAQQQELAQASAQQRIANCKSQCDAVENACDASVDNQNKQAGFGALAGMLTGNKSAAYGAVGGVTDTSQCAANAEACAAGCN